jgi:hypothetical protein
MYAAKGCGEFRMDGRLFCGVLGKIFRAQGRLKNQGRLDSERFRSTPKDLRALPVHAEPDVSRHSGLRRGAHARTLARIEKSSAVAERGPPPVEGE